MQKDAPRWLHASLRRAIRSVDADWRSEGYDTAALGTACVFVNPRYSRRLATADAGRWCVTLRADAASWSTPLLRQVLVHELAHLAVYRRHGVGIRPHGPEWRRLMELSGLEVLAQLPGTCGVVRAGPQVPRNLTLTSSPRLMYEHRCPVCQMVRLAKRPVRGWRCRACVEAGLVGALQVSRRPSDS